MQDRVLKKKVTIQRELIRVVTCANYESSLLFKTNIMHHEFAVHYAVIQNFLLIMCNAAFMALLLLYLHLKVKLCIIKSFDESKPFLLLSYLKSLDLAFNKVKAPILRLPLQQLIKTTKKRTSLLRPF